MKNGKCMRSGAQPRSFSAQPRQRSPTRNAEGFRSVKVPWPYPPLPEYVFRTMERSLEDMTYHENRRMFEDIPDVDLISKEDVIMRKLVMKTLSSVRQWLLPACATHRSALLWYKKAQNSGRDNCGHMVRISTQALGPDRIIDVSTQSAQKAFFRGNYDQWGLAGVDDVGKYLKRAIANGEVELMWRGRININLMEVVDPDTGDYLMHYKDALAQDHFNYFCLGQITSNAPQRLRSLLETVIGKDDAIRIHLIHRDLLPTRASCKGLVIGARGKAQPPIKPQPAPYARTEIPSPMPSRLPPGSPGAPPPKPLAWDPTPPPKPPAWDPTPPPTPPARIIKARGSVSLMSVDRDGQAPFKMQRTRSLQEAMDKRTVASDGTPSSQSLQEATDKLTVATDGTPPVRGRSLFDTDSNAREATPSEELEQILLARSKAKALVGNSQLHPRALGGHQHNAVEAEPLASAGPQPTGVHIEEEVDFDPPEQPEIEELADPAEQAEEAALLAFKSHWNLTKAWERRVVEVPELTGPNRTMMEAVVLAERNYLAECHTIKTKYINDMRPPSYCSDPHRQGFQGVVSTSRIRAAEAAFDSPSAQAMAAELEILGAIHYGCLMDIAKQANRETLPHWIPLAPFSITVLRAHSGTRPGRYPGIVEYAKIFDELGLIKSGKMPGQRTCGKTVVETPIPDTLPLLYEWGPWFLGEGGFSHPDDSFCIIGAIGT